MIHSFAFFRTLYGSFLDEEGRYRKHNDILTKVKMEGKNKKVKFLSSPLVKEWSKLYFNDASKPGAMLDYQDTSHWEDSEFHFDEIMSHAYQQDQKLSLFSLALLQDTGWYKVNFDFCQPMTYQPTGDQDSHEGDPKCQSNETLEELRRNFIERIQTKQTKQ